MVERNISPDVWTQQRLVDRLGLVLNARSIPPVEGKKLLQTRLAQASAYACGGIKPRIVFESEQERVKSILLYLARAQHFQRDHHKEAYGKKPTYSNEQIIEAACLVGVSLTQDEIYRFNEEINPSANYR